MNVMNVHVCMFFFFVCLFFSLFFSEKTSFLVSFLPCKLAKKKNLNFHKFLFSYGIQPQQQMFFFFEIFLKLFTETIAWNTCEKDLPLLQAFTEVTSKCHSYFKAEQCHE